MLNLLKFFFRITGIYQLFISLARRTSERMCGPSDQDEEVPQNENNVAVPADSFYQKHIKEKLCRGLHNLLMQEEMIIIHRMPPRNVLRAHLLGLTLALSFVIFTMISGIKFPEGVPIPARIEDCFRIFDCFELNIGQEISASGELLIILLLIFIFGTYIGGPFVIFLAILYFLFFILNLLSNIEFLQLNVFIFLSKWFLLGYSFGVVLGLLYNDLVFLHTRFFNSKFVKISLAAFRTEDFNVIKSPDELEESAMLKYLKSILYFVRQIKNDHNSLVNANNIVNQIKKAVRKMKRPDIKELINWLPPVPGSGDRENLSEKLDYFQEKLSQGTNLSLSLLQNHIEPLVDKYLESKEEKLFNYNPLTRPLKPYTILFVANPFFCKKFSFNEQEDYKQALEEHRNNSDNFEIDPIINDKELFYRTVDRALLSFQNDEVLGSPEIWSRIRIITIFPENLIKQDPPIPKNEFGLVEAVQDQYVLDNRLIENLSVPLIHEVGAPVLPDANFTNLILAYLENFNKLTEHGLENFQDLNLNDINIDVIFALSAKPENDRSTALFSTQSFRNNGVNPPVDAGDNKDNPYDFQTEFEDTPTEGITVPVVKEFDHEFKSNFNGKVAINVIGVRQKTFIHEFGHAMSSNENGAIVDEYFDQMQVGLDIRTSPAPHAINRLERNQYSFQSIPERFAKYNNLVYLPDLDHPSAEEFWIGYFPQRTAPFIGCTMDRTIGHYQFDPLIKRFMYDRIIAKLNRP